MPKSKRSLKRRKKLKKNPNKLNRLWDSSGSNNDYSFDAPYMKTDSEGRVLKFTANHKFIGYATEEESRNF